MQLHSKKETLAASSGWVATTLNFFPGLGAGYIYQRRWTPYFITATIALVWFIAGAVLNKGEVESSEFDKLIGLGGLLFISLITMVEAQLAYRKSIKELKNEINSKLQSPKKRRGLFWG